MPNSRRRKTTPKTKETALHILRRPVKDPVVAKKDEAKVLLILRAIEAIARR